MLLQPLVIAWRRHRLATLLLVLEIAIAYGVLCNACYLVAGRLATIRSQSGLDESSLAAVQLSGSGAGSGAAINAAVLAGIRSIPGVQEAGVLNTVPFGMQKAAVEIARQPEGGAAAKADFYIGGEGSIEALGLRVISGRLPATDDYLPLAGSLPADGLVLVTKSLSDYLWPQSTPLGKEFWVDKRRFRVIGILERLPIARPGSRGNSSINWSIFAPVKPGDALVGSYVLRASEGDMQRVLSNVEKVVATIVPDIVFDRAQSQTIETLRKAYFQRDISLIALLAGVVMALLLVAAFGIGGLASFWVEQRRRHIGIRRALGATRRDIRHQFQAENFSIVTAGIAVGVVIAIGLSLIYTRYYAAPTLPLSYLLIGGLSLWLLGQVAVLGPAIRAAAVEPVAAIRFG
ncbi:ABC transporter permease [Dyella subtropica]|uniref:ABC transporter permease n=1 Tax=Dyella subtropica TaxID=2992127 RepID=UPI002256FFAB|nr:FtsX-like permease family protein [Dyella subtropica]